MVIQVQKKSKGSIHYPGISENQCTASFVQVQSITLHGKVYPKNYLTHADLVKGGKLLVELATSLITSGVFKPENQPFRLSTK